MNPKRECFDAQNVGFIDITIKFVNKNIRM